MPTLRQVLEGFDPYALLRDTTTKIVRTARNWLREDGALDPGNYERGRYQGASAVMFLVSGMPEAAMVEVHADNLVHQVIERLEEPLRDAFSEFIPLVFQEAAAELRHAMRYAEVNLLEVEDYALTALFAFSSRWRMEGSERQHLWTPALRFWVRNEIRSAIRRSARLALATARTQIEQAAGREQHARNLESGSMALLGRLADAVLPMPQLGIEARGLAERASEISKRAKANA